MWIRDSIHSSLQRFYQLVCENTRYNFVLSQSPICPDCQIHVYLFHIYELQFEVLF